MPLQFSAQTQIGKTWFLLERVNKCFVVSKIEGAVFLTLVLKIT